MRFLLCLLLLLPSLSWAGMNGYVCGASIPAATCSTNADACDGSSAGSIDIGQGATSTYTAIKFIAGANETICGAQLVLATTGASDPSHTYNVYIYANTCSTCDRSDDAVSNTVVGTGSTNTVAWTDIGASYGYVTFTGMNASLTSGEVYWLVLKVTGTPNTTNHTHWSYVTSCAVEGEDQDADGTDWGSPTSTTVSGEYQLLR